MYKVITAILNKDTNNLIIALDENQNLYRRKLSWKDVGVSARGKRLVGRTDPKHDLRGDQEGKVQAIYPLC